MKSVAELNVSMTVVLASKNGSPNKILVFPVEGTDNQWALPSAVPEGTSSVNSLEALLNIIETLRLTRSGDFRLWWNLKASETSPTPTFIWRVLGNINPDALNVPCKWFDIGHLQIAEEPSQSLFLADDDLLIGMYRLQLERGEVDSSWFGDFTELRQRLRLIFHLQE